MPPRPPRPPEAPAGPAGVPPRPPCAAIMATDAAQIRQMRATRHPDQYFILVAPPFRDPRVSWYVGNIAFPDRNLDPVPAVATLDTFSTQSATGASSGQSQAAGRLFSDSWRLIAWCGRAVPDSPGRPISGGGGLSFPPPGLRAHCYRHRKACVAGSSRRDRARRDRCSGTSRNESGNSTQSGSHNPPPRRCNPGTRA